MSDASVITSYMNVNNDHMPQEEKEFDAIDIYLFTNGEETLPPRKYHIQKQQLYTWDDTRSYLAESHYGTPSSPIDIYTLDGVQITDPLTLKDGFTYVAVLTEERFKPARYKEYILRASRSLEKRIEKLRASENKIQDSNKIDREIKHTREHTSSNYKTLSLDVCKNEVGGSVISEKVKLFEKKINSSKPTPKSTWKTIGIANSKWSEDRKDNNQQKRGPLKTLKPPLLTSGAALTAQTKRTVSNKFDASLRRNKPNINKQATENKTNTNSNTLFLAIIPSKHSDSENKNKTPVSMAIENLYKEGLDPSINIIEREIDYISYINEASTLKQGTTNKERISLDRDDLRTFVERVLEESAKSKTTAAKINDALLDKCYNQNNNHKKHLATRNETYSTALNKGEILNLKVSIQLHNNESTPIKENFNTNQLTKDITIDKVSQTDADVTWNDELLKKNHEETDFCIKTISLQSLFNPKNTSSKIEITPHSEKTENNALSVQRLCSPLQKNDSKDEINAGQTEQNCMFNANRDFVVLTAYNNSQKNACFSCVSRTSGVNDQQKPPAPKKEYCNTCKDLNKQEECKKFYVSRPCVEIEGHKVEYFIRKKESESSLMSDENKGKEYVVCKRVACDVCPKTVVDQFVQTDISKTVFEIRPHRDGHYTFHLPPLCFIKHHKL